MESDKVDELNQEFVFDAIDAIFDNEHAVDSGSDVQVLVKK